MKLSNSLLNTVLVRIGSCLKLVLGYKFLIFNNVLPQTLRFYGQGCGDRSLFFETKRGLREKIFGGGGRNVLERPIFFQCVSDLIRFLRHAPETSSIT